MKTFKINENTYIKCWVYENRRYDSSGSGWGHKAQLIKNNNVIFTSRIKYYNRTWESFEFESAIRQLLHKTRIFTEAQEKEFIIACQKNNTEELNAKFGLIAGIAKLGEVFCDNQKDKNNWKERMIKAGLGNQGLIMPEDWDSLSEEERQTRLDGVINQLSEKL